ncbi:MAG: putative sulfate exporter family transporter [Nitrospirae bacterium]|nr:putative sulfate exporter family transporter [Nitrospirota bacterium]
MNRSKNIAFGLAVTLIISIVSYLTSSLHPSFDTLVISIIFGLLVPNMFGDKTSIEEGAKWAIKVFLPIGIGLYGMQIKFTGVEIKYWPMVVGVIPISFFVTYFISRGFGLEKTLSILLATGMSICGASAIIVIAPLIGAKKEDTSISLLSILTVGLVGMLIYKFFTGMLGLSVREFGIFTGMTLPMFGQIKVAAASMGAQSLEFATNIKLLRIAFLTVIAFSVLIFAGTQKKRLYVPWFMILFFVLALAVNLSEGVASLRTVMEIVSRLSLSIALAAIGLTIDIDSIAEKGARPLFSAFFGWGIVVLLLYLLLNLINV